MFCHASKTVRTALCCILTLCASAALHCAGLCCAVPFMPICLALSGHAGAVVDTAADRRVQEFFLGGAHKPLFMSTFESPLETPSHPSLCPFYRVRKL